MLAQIILTIYFENKAPENTVIEGDSKFSKIHEILSEREVFEYEITADGYDITADYLYWMYYNGYQYHYPIVSKFQIRYNYLQLVNKEINKLVTGYKEIYSLCPKC